MVWPSFGQLRGSAFTSSTRENAGPRRRLAFPINTLVNPNMWILSVPFLACEEVVIEITNRGEGGAGGVEGVEGVEGVVGEAKRDGGGGKGKRMNMRT